jgi:hypothetical protein
MTAAGREAGMPWVARYANCSGSMTRPAALRYDAKRNPQLTDNSAFEAII